MDLQELERIVTEEVKKALGEREREEETSYPPDPNVTLDAGACSGPSCTMPTASDAMPAASNPPLSAPIPAPATASSAGAPSSDGPAILLLFTGAREKWDVLSDAFRAWREQGVQLDAMFSSSSQYVISPDEISSLGIRSIDRPEEVRHLIYDLSRYMFVFLPSISRTHAAKLALGITDSLPLNMTLSALAQKKKVYASNDGLEPTACVACGNQVPGIQEILDNYRDQLSKMGVKLLPAEKAVEVMSSAALNQAESGP
ncbi:MAG: hypothetical protein JXR73_06575, partial [Candidatus Omnitrophica bacterium]|nr:hypothetical protein [Candidatus Omnitrophota bacterium]